MFNGWVEAAMTQNEINVMTLGSETDASVIEQTVRQLVAIAEVMGHPAEVDVALAWQQQGHLGRAVDELHEINERNPNPFTQLLEAEALVEHGEHERAVEVIAPAFLDGAGGREAQGWKQLADHPSPVAMPAPLSSGASESNWAAQHVVDDLFGSQLMSYEIVERFEQQYMNHRVSWMGTVTQVHAYRSDSDFADGPGLKVTALLGTAGGSSLLTNEVHAVVQLPADAQVERDAQLSFVGTLLHVDRFARKLYLSSGVVA